MSVNLYSVNIFKTLTLRERLLGHVDKTWHVYIDYILWFKGQNLPEVEF